MKLDQTADTSHLQLYKILTGVSVPDYVKEASVDNEEDMQLLEKEAFADEERRVFPLNSPARVYLSSAFLREKQAMLSAKYSKGYVDALQQKLATAAEVFGITQDLEAYNQAAEKRASFDYPEVFIATIEDPALSEEPISLFPVKTAEAFKTAAETFAAKMKNFPFAWRHQIADGFVEKASMFGVNDLPDIVCKYAEMFFPNALSDIEGEIRRRAAKHSNPEKQAAMNALADTVDTITPSVQDVMKLAEQVDELEQSSGILKTSKMSQLLPDPVDVFFTISPEKAAEILNVVEMGGEKFAMKDLQKVSADKYKEAFGADLDPADEAKLAEVLPTMPLSDVALFKELTSISPV